MKTATMNIDTTLVGGEYQALATWRLRGPDGDYLQTAHKSHNQDARESVCESLAEVGFREYQGDWYSRDCHARIVIRHAGEQSTVGIEITRDARLASSINQELDAK